jgi:pyruvate formate lyase activating enzyme
MMDTPSTPLETLDRAWRIGRDAGLDFVYMGNVPASELNNTRCPACQAVVVDRSRFPHAPAAMTDEGSCRLCGEPVLVTRAVKEPAA